MLTGILSVGISFQRGPCSVKICQLSQKDVNRTPNSAGHPTPCSTLSSVELYSVYSESLSLRRELQQLGKARNADEVGRSRTVTDSLFTPFETQSYGLCADTQPGQPGRFRKTRARPWTSLRYIVSPTFPTRWDEDQGSEGCVLRRALFKVPKQQNGLRWALSLHHWPVSRAVIRNGPVGFVS